MSAEIYLLDWQTTAQACQPEPMAVAQWLISQGFILEGVPKVYANGTVQVECEPSPEAVWPTFTLEPVSREHKLAAQVTALLASRKKLQALPASQQTPTTEGLLATMALLLAGYGVEDD